MTGRRVGIALIAATLAAHGVANAQSSRYAGQQARAVKALSPQDIDDLLQGRGMGLAKPAELNRYPGPLHVLELKERLGLDSDQAARVQAIFDRMSEGARRLGREIVDRERSLDALFAEQRVTAESLNEAVAGIASLSGRLREIHLAAHLETRALLTPAQITRYDELRGYADGRASHGGGHHGHHPRH